MTTTLSPVPKLSFLDSNGKPLVGGKLFTYTAGTSTKRATYTDSTGGTPNSNPIVLNFRGEANVWIPPNVAFKYVLARPTDTDPPGNPIWTVDQIANSQLLTLYGGVDTGSANAYILNFVANFDGYADGEIIYWIPANNNTGASTINVNGLGPVAIINQDGTPLFANQLTANQVVGIMYKGTGFLLLFGAFQGLTLYGGTDTGAANAYVLPFTGQFAANTNGVVIYWIPSHTNTTASTLNVKSQGALDIINVDGSALNPGQLVAGVLAQVVYQDGDYILLTTQLTRTGTFTATLTGGFTGAVTGSCNYAVVGSVVSIWFPATIGGTSNGTGAITMTGLSAPGLLPASGSASRFVPVVLTDNGADITGRATVTPSGITLQAGFAPTTTFTGSGAKGIPAGSFIQYDKTSNNPP